MGGDPGIRHENIMIVREAKELEHQFGDAPFLAFEHITFMPFQVRGSLATSYGGWGVPLSRAPSPDRSVSEGVPGHTLFDFRLV
jgi:hypothetical protein